MQKNLIKKIAVLRANALGDFIFSLPALKALRQTFPSAEIVLLGKKWHKEFLTARTCPVDRVVVVPELPGIGEANDFVGDWEEITTFFRSMKREKFDIAVQMHGGGKFSNPFVKDLGAKLTVGLRTQDAVPLDMTIPYIYYQHEYLRYLEVVGLVGAKTQSLAPSLSVTESDISSALPIVKNLEKPFVVLHPGASDARRRWSTTNFAAIGDFLSERGFSVVITGTRSEKNIVQDVVQHMQTPAVNTCGLLSLSGLIGLLSQASLVIANDTGPFHVSYALKVPAIGLFWCGNMINGAPLSRNKIRPLISWVTACPLCGEDCASFYPFLPHNSCQHKVSFVSGITEGEVRQTIEEMIAEGIVLQQKELLAMRMLKRQYVYE